MIDIGIKNIGSDDFIDICITDIELLTETLNKDEALNQCDVLLTATMELLSFADSGDISDIVNSVNMLLSNRIREKELVK